MDEEEFKNLIEKNQGLAYTAAKLAKVNDKTLSLQDQMQVVWLRLLQRGFGKFDPIKCSFSHYVSLFGKFAILESLKGPSRKQNWSGHVKQLPNEVLTVRDWRKHYIDPAKALEEKDFCENLLNHLRPQEKKIVKLVYLEGFSVVEAAKKLGVTRQHVNALKNEALKKMKEIILAG